MKRYVSRMLTPLLLGVALVAGAFATVSGQDATKSAPRLSPVEHVYDHCPPGQVFNVKSGKCQKR